MSVPEGVGHRVFVLRNHHEMQMVRHQAVAESTKTVLCGMLPQKRDIDLAKRIGQEDVASAITALRDVMWQTGSDRAGHSRHNRDSARWQDYFSGNF